MLECSYLVEGMSTSEKFKDLGVLYTSDGRMKQDIVRWIRVSSAVTKWLLYSAVVRIFQIQAASSRLTLK